MFFPEMLCYTFLTKTLGLCSKIRGGRGGKTVVLLVKEIVYLQNFEKSKRVFLM